MAEKTTQPKDQTAVWISRRLGTRELLDECAGLTPRDDYGRKLPLYGVRHKALEAYRATLNGKAGAGPTSPRKSRRIGP